MIGTSNQQTENGMNVATRGTERQYGEADQIEAKANEWLNKIDVNEVLTYIDLDSDAEYAMAKASSTNDAEAIGLVFMAVKRNYAERLALRDLELEDAHLLSDGGAALHALTTWLIGRAAKFNRGH
jgi:hypothetical protein